MNQTCRKVLYSIHHGGPQAVGLAAIGMLCVDMCNNAKVINS